MAAFIVYFASLRLFALPPPFADAILIFIADITARLLIFAVSACVSDFLDMIVAAFAASRCFLSVFCFAIAAPRQRRWRRDTLRLSEPPLIAATLPRFIAPRYI